MQAVRPLHGNGDIRPCGASTQSFQTTRNPFSGRWKILKYHSFLNPFRVSFVETARSVFEKYVTNSSGKKRRKGFKNGISVFSGSLRTTQMIVGSLAGNFFCLGHAWSGALVRWGEMPHCLRKTYFLFLSGICKFHISFNLFPGFVTLFQSCYMKHSTDRFLQTIFPPRGNLYV